MNHSGSSWHKCAISLPFKGRGGEGVKRKAQTTSTIIGRQLQRILRCHMTDAELRLWHRLRNRQLAGCKFRRIHPYLDYVLDFVCLEKSLIVEVDG
ncbi:MAG: DUF559 domain-containing protein, partial [Gallionella sp.]